MKHEEFYLKVAYALSGCQLIEQELKLYLTQAFELINKCINNKLVFKFSGDDYANASLERLIEAFQKLTNNEELVKELRAFKDERNFLSHKGISHCLDYEGDLFESTAQEFQIRLDQIEKQAINLRNKIHNESADFLGYLYFDDLTENDAG
ncbi:hypothetical protein [uncultured Tolumonas sp.]|uniref:hypothetical protein n=1 Tax=uncultured Tolumonas sp. TaxID=263765 RepID=UPI002931AB2D|nr:hypothetical protein [uncultured Tolumonas sp.]